MAWYALPQVPHGFALLPVVNYVPAFYSEYLGLPLALVGLMLVLTRVTDVITDPLIGAFSDRTRSRFGRRKPFILAGLPILLIATWFVFVPPSQVTPAYLFWGLFFMYLGFTIVDIPYQSWGAELSDDYDERSKVQGWRSIANSLGSLVTLSIPVVLQLAGYKDLAVIMMAMAICFIVLQPLCFGLAMWRVPEPAAETLPQPTKSMLSKWKTLLGNTALLRLCGAVGLLVAGMAIGATLNLIIFTHVAGQPEMFAPAVFVQNVAAIIGIPLWVKLAGHLGKHRAIAVAVLIIGALSAATFLVGRSEGLLLASIVIAIGFAMGGCFALIAAMIGDLVDHDLVETGEERTGLMFAALGMATKFAIVIGVLIGTAIPGLAGFQPSDATHDPDSLFVLRAVFAFVTPLLAAIAAWLLWSYPLTRDRQLLLRERIAEMRLSGRPS